MPCMWLPLVCLQRELKGRTYYELEFTAANPKYTRHQLAVVACANGAACIWHGHVAVVGIPPPLAQRLCAGGRGTTPALRSAARVAVRWSTAVAPTKALAPGGCACMHPYVCVCVVSVYQGHCVCACACVTHTRAGSITRLAVASRNLGFRRRQACCHMPNCTPKDVVACAAFSTPTFLWPGWVAACDPGTFYTLTTGSNERRWGKIKDKLQATVSSFQLIN